VLFVLQNGTPRILAGESLGAWYLACCNRAGLLADGLGW
jgi:hypothetical protein